MSDEQFLDDSKYPRFPLDAAVQAVLAEPLPDDAIARVKTRARELSKSPMLASSQLQPQVKQRWSIRRRVLAGLAIAASLLFLLTSLTALLDRSNGRVFAEMTEKLKAVRSVRLKTAMRFGHEREIKGQMYLEGDRLRFEQFDRMLVQIGDLGTKQALFLDMDRKLAQSVEIDMNVAREFANPIEQLRTATSKDAQRIGEEVLKGRRTQVYRLRNVNLLGFKGNVDTTVWIDAESELPARIVIRDPDPTMEIEIRFDEFVWNEPLDAQMFALNAPAGFQTGIVVMMPRVEEPSKRDADLPDSAPAFVDGILRDRVPARVVWDPHGTTITAIMRDPESVAPLETRLNTLRQWDVTTGKPRWSQNISGASSLAITADGKTLATAIGSELQLRDSASGNVIRKWATDAVLPPVAFSPDGKRLIAGIAGWGSRGAKEYGGVQIWDTERSALVRTIADDKPTTFVSYSVDGKHVAGASNSGPVKLWDAATGELFRVFPGWRPAFSPDGRFIACASVVRADNKVTSRVGLYDVESALLVRWLVSENPLPGSWPLSVAFSPDGHLLAAADWNATVTIWDVTTGERKLTLADNQAGVLCVVFSPDGKTLAIGSEDKTLRLWKLPTELIQPARSNE